MIRSIDIRNFRCFERLTVDGVRPMTLITGDNGSGKTALLEAIFLTLSSASGVAMRMRQQRGFDGYFAAPARRLEETFWGGLFHQQDTQKTISISLEGNGDANRSLTIARSRSELVLSLQHPDRPLSATTAPISFTWRNGYGESNSVTPTFNEGNVSLPETGEDMPNFFFIPAFAVIGSAENAGRFSDLSQINAQRTFVDIFTREFNWIEDLAIEVTAGSPAIFATVKGTGKKVPLPEVSSGLNRMVAILLAIASRRDTIVLIDELENGIYFKHYRAFWSAVLALCRENNSQVFVTSHSAECISAFGDVLGVDYPFVELWQIERDEKEPIRRVAGKKLSNALEFNMDVR